MSTRQRIDCATIFDVCCSLIYDKNGASDVKIIYPPEFSDETVLRSLKQFCFPYQLSKSDENEAVQLFTFVRTDSQSLYTFGYCKFTPRTNSCICILSGFLWANFFYKLLNHISTVYSNGTPADVESLLTNAYHMDIPAPGSSFKLTACTKIGRFSDTIPNLSNLSTLRDDKFLLEIFNALNEKQMIQLYSSLLKERRIIFTTTRLSQLSSCVFGLSKLCYPFHWQNLFIPILPQELTDTLMAPMPYLIGIPKQNFCKINRADFGDVVIMDLDEKVLTSPYQDKLPAEAYNFLQNRLKFSSDVFLSDSFARAFLQTNVILFGNYTSGFTKDMDGSYKWDRKLFIERERPNLRPFLHSLIGKDGVQYFERFIEERLQSLNQDKVIIDEFEREIQSLGVRRYLEGNHGVLPKPPEFLHQAVSSVKENAADVFGALKDQFTSISVKEKLSTLKQKESGGHRWSRPRSATRKKSKSNQIDPLSIDTSQFNFEQTINSTSLKADENGESDAASVHSVDDLIDLNEGPSSSHATATTLTNNIHSSPNLQFNSMAQQNGTSNNDLLSLLSPTPSQPFIPLDTPKTVKDRKSTWEKFE